MNKWMNEWLNDSMNQWLNESMNQWINESMNQWINESMNQWTNEPMNQWINKSMNQWINESRYILFSRARHKTAHPSFPRGGHRPACGLHMPARGLVLQFFLNIFPYSHRLVRMARMVFEKVVKMLVFLCFRWQIPLKMLASILVGNPMAPWLVWGSSGYVKHT